MSTGDDCAASILFCAEDNSSILGFDDEKGDEVGDAAVAVSQPERRDLFGDFLIDFPPYSDECLAAMVDRECEHLPREGYAERLRLGSLDLAIRRDAIDWIWKVHAHYSFGPLSAYLAVNYLDRFLSAYELPQGKAWMTQLLSVACLSLAAKMDETEVPLSGDLQVTDAEYVFEAKTIQRMELLVLSTLRWRMQAVTPFSFIDFFLQNFNGGNKPSKLSISRCVQLILCTIRGYDFIALRPSEIAAAIALCVVGETQVVDIEKIISFNNHISKEGVLRCYRIIQDMVVMSRTPNGGSSSVASVPQSPIGVLDAARLSYKSDNVTIGSHTACYHDSPACKRRKINISIS